MTMSSAKMTRRRPFVQKYLEQIASTGIYGDTVEEVVEQFVLEGVRRELRRTSATRTIQDGSDSAAFALLCQKYACPVR
jgi:hypothetical protein